MQNVHNKERKKYIPKSQRKQKVLINSYKKPCIHTSPILLLYLPKKGKRDSSLQKS